MPLSEAFVDPVTGLPNRTGLLAETPQKSTLLLVNVDWTARSARGLDSRDRVARAVAAVLSRLLPSDVLLARYADDVFALRMHGGRARPALALAKRILTAFERPIAAADEDDEISGTPSVGIVTGGTDVAAQVQDLSLIHI